jgi:S1-C subfamily serine protease
VGIDSAKVDDFDELYNVLDAHHAGDKVDVKIRRGEETVTVKLEVLVLP